MARDSRDILSRVIYAKNGRDVNEAGVPYLQLDNVIWRGSIILANRKKNERWIVRGPESEIEAGEFYSAVQARQWDASVKQKSFFAKEKCLKSLGFFSWFQSWRSFQVFLNIIQTLQLPLKTQMKRYEVVLQDIWSANSSCIRSEETYRSTFAWDTATTIG